MYARSGALLLLATLLLAGCGNLTDGAGAKPMNTDSPTRTSGPVVIETDHSAYNGADTITVTIINHLTTAIYAYDTQASCSILSLEVQQNGNWASSSAMRCAMGRMARWIEIKPGATYTANLGGGRGMGPGSGGALANGAYRLVLRYASSAADSVSGAPTFTEVDSATLTVSDTIPPNATATP